MLTTSAPSSRSATGSCDPTRRSSGRPIMRSIRALLALLGAALVLGTCRRLRRRRRRADRPGQARAAGVGGLRQGRFQAVAAAQARIAAEIEDARSRERLLRAPSRSGFTPAASSGPRIIPEEESSPPGPVASDGMDEPRRSSGTFECPQSRLENLMEDVMRHHLRYLAAPSGGGFHPDRAAGRDRHHRRADRPACCRRCRRPARRPGAPSAPTT